MYFYPQENSLLGIIFLFLAYLLFSSLLLGFFLSLRSVYEHPQVIASILHTRSPVTQDRLSQQVQSMPTPDFPVLQKCQSRRPSPLSPPSALLPCSTPVFCSPALKESLFMRLVIIEERHLCFLFLSFPFSPGFHPLDR